MPPGNRSPARGPEYLEVGDRGNNRVQTAAPPRRAGWCLLVTVVSPCARFDSCAEGHLVVHYHRSAQGPLGRPHQKAAASCGIANSTMRQEVAE